MQVTPDSRWRRCLASTSSVAVALLLSVGCEIVQSNIPITLESDEEVEEDAGGVGLPEYPGPACGVASAILCTLTRSPGIDASLQDANASDADADVDAATLDAGPNVDATPSADSATDSDAATVEDGEAGSEEPPRAEWCALRCFERCDTGEWECTGTVCGHGEPPPSCEPAR